MKKLCIIVINFFSHESTIKCIESLKGQSFNTLYLIDNSNDTEQAQLTKTLATSLHKEPFDTAVIINKKNLGFGTAINNAIKKDLNKTQKHQNYLLLNNDTILPKETLEVLLHEKASHPNAALISPEIQWGDKKITYYGYNKYFGHVTSPNAILAQPFLSGCCLLVDHSLTDKKKGLFDDDFFMYGEDIWLNWKAKKLGKDIFCSTKVTIFHEGSGSSSHGNEFYEYHVARGHILLCTKLSENRIDQIFMFFGRLAYLPTRALIRSIRFKNLKPLTSLISAFGNKKNDIS